MTIENRISENQVTNQNRLEVSDVPIEQKREESSNKGAVIGISIAALLIVVGLVAGGVLLIQGNENTVAKIRDVFIIFMALETMLIGLVMIILVVQLARLTNLLQNEIKPILDSTNDTVSTLRGTTRFLSDNLVEPVIKLNEYLAGLQSFIKLVKPARKPKNK
jgi:hypothetical protein